MVPTKNPPSQTKAVISTVHSGKIVKNSTTGPAISASRVTALGEMFNRHKSRPQSGAIVMVDRGFGVGRAPDGETEAFPLFVDVSPPSDHVEYHCMKCCKHTVCRLMKEREVEAALRLGKKMKVLDCSNYMVCRKARRKNRGLRTLSKY
jgi:hypothetical protein